MQWEKDKHSEEYYSLGPYAEAVQGRLSEWSAADFARRMWARDGTLWVPDPQTAAQDPDLENRMGWLDLPTEGLAQLGSLTAFAEEIQAAGYTDAVVLGMGGSSLAPEVYAQVFGPGEGYLRLHVLDSTHPEAVRNLAKRIDPLHTLFIVSSKSGGTIETLSFFKYFFPQVAKLCPEPGRNFVVITDPGSSLENAAREQGFRQVFPGLPSVGGRYSALSNFGLVPAVLLGVPLEQLLERAEAMARRCGPEVPVAKNPALVLGAAWGELGRAGRDKITLLLSPALLPFSSWAEQLIAESTGKNGTGLVPVPEQTPAGPEAYGEYRLFVSLRLEGDDNATLDAGLDALEAAGHPVIRFRLADRLELGAEFFRWEMATAAAGAVLEINPFNQPNVQAAKIAAIRLMQAYQASGALPAQEPTLVSGPVEVFNGSGDGTTLSECLRDFLAQAQPGDYVGLMAYLAPTPETDAVLETMRTMLGDRLHLAVTLGYGPRFLHSTGQLHKGGPNTGLFLQITQSAQPELPIPGEAYDFGTLISAQALGDYQALSEHGRRVMRLSLREDSEIGLEALRTALAEVFG